MIKEFQYIKIQELLSRLLRHPLLQDTQLEQVIQYVIDFQALFGSPNMFKNENIELHIDNYRALLPCNCLSINQILDKKSNICLRSMTNTFGEDKENDLTFKTQGQVLFTSFKSGDVIISYKSIPIDEDGFPMLMDNPVYLKTLEAYIKKELFTILFDMGKINNQVLQNAQQNYGFLAGQLQSELTIPSVSEMESLKNLWTSMIQKNTAFYDGFKRLGNIEHFRTH